MSCCRDAKGVGLPVPFTLHTAAWDLKQAVRAIPAHYLVQNTSRTADLVAVLAVEEVLEGIQAVVGSRSSRVEGAFVLVCFFSAGWVDSSNFLGRYRRVCAGALEICIWLELGHVVLWKLEKIIFRGSRLRALHKRLSSAFVHFKFRTDTPLLYHLTTSIHSFSQKQQYNYNIIIPHLALCR